MLGVFIFFLSTSADLSQKFFLLKKIQEHFQSVKQCGPRLMYVSVAVVNGHKMVMADLSFRKHFKDTFKIIVSTMFKQTSFYSCACNILNMRFCGH